MERKERIISSSYLNKVTTICKRKCCGRYFQPLLHKYINCVYGPVCKLCSTPAGLAVATFYFITVDYILFWRSCCGFAGNSISETVISDVQSLGDLFPSGKYSGSGLCPLSFVLDILQLLLFGIVTIIFDEHRTSSSPQQKQQK